MAKTNFNDLFKSEIAADNGNEAEQPICDCPHCEMPILKSEVLAKSKSGGGPNKKVKAENGSDGGTNRGGKPRSGAVKVNRTGAGVPKHTDQAGATQLAKGDEDEEGDEEDVEKADEPVVKKSLFRGSEYVQYIDTGEDEALAKSIEAGFTGPNSPVRPIDDYAGRGR